MQELWNKAKRLAVFFFAYVYKWQLMLQTMKGSKIDCQLFLEASATLRYFGAENW